MQNLGWKSIAEALGIAAIVASLIFVGLQLRQSQEIAIAETYMSILSSEIEVRNAVSEHADLWKKANSGAELDEAEAVIFGNLVANLNSEANRSMNQLRRLGHTAAAKSQVHQFASFLHQNPAARQVWTVQNEIWGTHRALLGDNPEAASYYPSMVLDDLYKLDAISD